MEGRMRAYKGIVSLLFVLILGIVIFYSCGKRDSQLVARVGGRKITIKDFEKEFAVGKKTQQVRTASLEDKKIFLQKLINKKLKLICAYQNKLNEDETIKKLVEERKKSFMFRRLIEKEVVEKIIPESRVKKYYKNASKEVKIRQIVIKFNKDKPEQKTRALERARKIVRKLKHGDNFATLAREKSEDRQTAKEGGKLGYLKWGPNSYKNPIYVAAFSMKENEISGPIEKDNAYYVIKVIHIKKYQVPPYEQEKERIKQSIFRVHNKEIERAYYDYLDKLKKRYRLKFSDKGMKYFVNKLHKKVSKTDSSKEKKRKSIYDQFSVLELSKVVAELRFKPVTIKDLVETVKSYPSHRRPKFKTVEEVKEFLNGRVIPLLLLEQEIDTKNMRNDEVVKDQIKKYEESLMIRNIYRQMVTDKLKLTDEDLKTFFEAHREDYKHPPMRNVQQIYVKDKKLADKIVRFARNGADFTSLFKKYNEKKALEKNLGKLGYISKGRAGIGRPAFNVEVGGVTDPILIGNGYSIIKVLSEKPEMLKTFEESKKLVKAKLRRIKTKELEEKWLEDMRKKINVVIYEKNLELAGKYYIGEDDLILK